MKEKGQNKNVRTEEKKLNTNKKRSAKGKNKAMGTSLGTPFDASALSTESSMLNVTRRKNIKNPRVKKIENIEESFGNDIIGKVAKNRKASQVEEKKVPKTKKGIKSVVLASTMGPGVKVLPKI